jgi:hypothetical protein
MDKKKFSLFAGLLVAIKSSRLSDGLLYKIINTFFIFSSFQRGTVNGTLKKNRNAYCFNHPATALQQIHTKFLLPGFVQLWFHFLPVGQNETLVIGGSFYIKEIMSLSLLFCWSR